MISVLLLQSASPQNMTGTPRKVSKHVSFGSLPTVRSSTPDTTESRMSRYFLLLILQKLDCILSIIVLVTLF